MRTSGPNLGVIAARTSAELPAFRADRRVSPVEAPRPRRVRRLLGAAPARRPGRVLQLRAREGHGPRAARPSGAPEPGARARDPAHLRAAHTERVGLSPPRARACARPDARHVHGHALPAAPAPGPERP